MLHIGAVLKGRYADRRRARGDYDRTTLAAYAAAWRESGSPHALLNYMLFRRDLGKRLPRRFIEPLLSLEGKFSRRERALAYALIAETAPSALAIVPAKRLNEAAECLPAIAGFLEKSGRRQLSAFGLVDSRQVQWREEFRHWLEARRAGGIYVVGNAASLIGAGLGGEIDSADAVVRFNLFNGPETRADDMGLRTNVWVVSPRFRGILPQEPEWAIMTGPDMRYRLQTWDTLMPRLANKQPVLTVPLAVWQNLVMELAAPPSAGLLMLAWLRVLLGGWKGIAIAGIGSGLSSSGRYHSANRAQQAVSRHRWEAERGLILQWKKQGLRDLVQERTDRQ